MSGANSEAAASMSAGGKQVEASILPQRTTRERLYSVDLLRGIAMVVMALDHVRDFMTYYRFVPEDLTQTTLALFFTRWVTHFCAPAFFFLAGTGAYLSASRGKTTAELSSFLWKRGLWLVILEGTIVGIAWTFIPGAGFLFGGVLWCLGWSMVVLAVLVRLPFGCIAAFGLGSIFLHNLMDTVTPQMFGGYGWIWQLLHQPGLIPIHGQVGFFVLYALVPWTGVMATGFVFGAILKKPAAERRRWLWAIGGGATALFLLLRLTNVYGNPPVATAFIPWAAGPFVVQPTWQKTLIAFLDTTKYPPSLQFLCMTLGPAIMALACFDRLDINGATGRVAQKLIIFGRVPLFFYVLHLYAAHIVAILAGLALGQPVRWLLWGGFFLNAPPPGTGHGLPMIYAAWIAICVLLYFPCNWFAGVKARRTDWWLSYL